MANLPSAYGVVVLIVEDEPGIRMLVAATAEEAGFVVIEAENADVAVSILESRTDVRIVFTDVDMPGSMDGLKLAAAVRGRWPPIEIIVTSGRNVSSDRDLPERCVFVAKPYQPEGVVATMRRLAA